MITKNKRSLNNSWILKFERINDHLDLIAIDVKTGEIIGREENFTDDLSVNKLSLADLERTLFNELNKQGYLLEINVNKMDEDGYYIVKHKDFKDEPNEKSIKNYSDDELIEEIKIRGYKGQIKKETIFNF